MEPNVDRGMWAVLALLIAVGIGAIVVVFFPKLVGDITAKMQTSVTGADIAIPPAYVPAP